MAIERMSLVSVIGAVKKVNRTLMRCCESECFHIIDSEHQSPDINYGSLGFKTFKDRNPFAPLVKRGEALALGMGIKIEQRDYSDIEYAVSIDFSKYFLEIEGIYHDFNTRLQKTYSLLKQHRQVLAQVEHLEGLNSDFEEIFALEYIKVRFGRLPVSSFEKLRYFEKMNFVFFSFEKFEDYIWGVYFTPAEEGAAVDDVFKSLYFERVRMPDYLKGGADDARVYIQSLIEEEEKEAEVLTRRITDLKERVEEKFIKVFNKLKAFDTSFELRGNVSVINNSFIMLGYVPEKKAENFINLIEQEETVKAQVMPDTDLITVPPVKLRNNRLFRPFEMFVSMYGLPEYGKADPTPFVAVTFLLLYGIMFGDLGQGLFMSLLGFILWKVKKIKLTPVIIRLGFTSAFFGYLYGSVFGHEGLIEPIFAKKRIYTLIGYSGAPHNIFEISSILLLASLFIGIIIIMISMVINIFINARSHNLKEAVFSASGVVGLVLYSAVIIGAGLNLGFGYNIFTIYYIVAFIIIPVIILFFKEQLAAIGHKEHKKEPKKIGAFIIEGIIEIFESGLTYITNTMSFLRIGGFILSHAGLMLVVNILAEKAGSAGSVGWIIVMVFGNLFVIGLEGFLVGIQVLRLEFYEMFSRFYKSGGTVFNPMAADLSINN